jgi:indole-3-glycerol phosphate synthase
MEARMAVLDEILEGKRSEIKQRQSGLSLPELKSRVKDLPSARSFLILLKDNSKTRIIAEIKKASPSAGIIRQEFYPDKIAQSYYAGGAAAISILTEENFFHGSINYLSQVKGTVPLPVIRKDFVIHPYQVYESRYYGADALLLIATILGTEELKDLVGLCLDIGLEPLVEVHSQPDLDKALATPATLIGINNRNLLTMRIDLSTTQSLLKAIPSTKTIISESGIKTREDIVRLESWGIKAFLIGEVLMQAGDIKNKLQELLGQGQRP